MKKILIYGSIGLFVLLFIIDYAQGQEVATSTLPIQMIEQEPILTEPILSLQEKYDISENRKRELEKLISQYAKAIDNKCN